MKLIHFIAEDQVNLGIQTEKGIIDVKRAAAAKGIAAPCTIEEVISGGKNALALLSELIKKEEPTISEEKIVYAPCVLNPQKILCIGLNYIDHGKECELTIPATPTLFSKFNNALAANHQVIQLPKSAEKFDYEAELVIVIGKKAAHVIKEDALSYVFGYTAGNDLSARDLQFLTGQWLLGKSCDQFAPLGPCVVTADEIDPNSLDIRCEVNGIVRQSSNTRQMIFDCAEIISYVSQYITLVPGDVIFTGTPSGVTLGYPEAERQWLKAGDKVTVSIEKIGDLVNTLE